MTATQSTEGAGGEKRIAVTATWTVELNCECPHCKEWVDLLEYPDFWDAHHGSLEVAEHHSARSKGVEVTCPECNKDFLIDCEY